MLRRQVLGSEQGVLRAELLHGQGDASGGRPRYLRRQRLLVLTCSAEQVWHDRKYL